MTRLSASGGQFLAQAPDVDVDGARAAGIAVAPDVGQEHVARQHPVAMPQQILEQQELLRGERDRRGRRRWKEVPHVVERNRPVVQRSAGAGGAARCARRSSARTRATSSFGLNGFAT